MNIEPAQRSQIALRLLTAEDEARFIELARMSVDLHRPWVGTPRTSSEFSTYLARSDQATAVCMVVCFKERADLVGMININGIVRGPYQRGVLGYAAFLPYAGRGYMSTGVALAVHYAFDQLRLHRVEADIQPGNTASLRLVRQLGFRKEGVSPGFIKIDGVWCDHERWAITREMELPHVR
ncbi:GNAT family protein [Streptomyces olivoreticuli]|uniref:GNAT family N-acetyltransferase n=1 Tax=Streptomyces olivoreticuli TaxID=68246 RepID=UPI000E246914|nr:GNAT family protein [Streptomyces olivoreticuli]